MWGVGWDGWQGLAFGSAGRARPWLEGGDGADSTIWMFGEGGVTARPPLGDRACLCPACRQQPAGAGDPAARGEAPRPCLFLSGFLASWWRRPLSWGRALGRTSGSLPDTRMAQPQPNAGRASGPLPPTSPGPETATGNLLVLGQDPHSLSGAAGAGQGPYRRGPGCRSACSPRGGGFLPRPSARAAADQDVLH